ncbi:hypothetical protein JCM11641_006724 [Rhodosporidiobolus odoratus]
MATLSDGTCCVCGEETTQKCGACGQAGFDLRFSSRDCQKVVWFVHKRVCGPGKANPFRFPPLTEDEVKRVVELKNTKMLFTEGIAGPSIWDTIESWSKLPAQQVLDALKTPSTALLGTEHTAHLTCTIRSYLLGHLELSAKSKVPTSASRFPTASAVPLEVFDPVSTLAVFATNQSATLRPRCGESCWEVESPPFVFMMHHALIFATLHYLQHQTQQTSTSAVDDTAQERARQYQRWQMVALARLWVKLLDEVTYDPDLHAALAAAIKALTSGTDFDERGRLIRVWV